MLKQRLPHKQIECAGLNAVKGSGAEKIAAQLASADNLDLSNHKAKQLTSEMIQEADLILVMTESQRRAIGQKSPAVIGKIMLFGQWLENSQTKEQGVEIPDPYNRSRDAFTHVHKLLLDAADAWQKRLNR